jgi:drug/metabolite transporter (DMT)-like permease
VEQELEDNLAYPIGWLCGACFLLAPIVAAMYLVQRRRRKAAQAILIAILALLCIVGTRALLIRAGIRSRPGEWLVVNSAALILVPLVAVWLIHRVRWPPAAVKG